MEHYFRYATFQGGELDGRRIPISFPTSRIAYPRRGDQIGEDGERDWVYLLKEDGPKEVSYELQS